MADGGVSRQVAEGAGKEESFELQFNSLHVMRLPSSRRNHIPASVKGHINDLGLNSDGG